jgi:hypothetical protein
VSIFTGTPQGSLPVLEIDGKKKICQSFAIARFLGNEFSMFIYFIDIFFLIFFKLNMFISWKYV